MNKWHYHGPYVAGLAMVLWAISLSFAIVKHHPLSPLGQVWLLIAVVAGLSFLPWRQIAVKVVAFFYRNAPRARAVGAAAVPHAQAAGQAVGRGAQNLRQKASAAVQKLYREALKKPLLTLGVLLMVSSVLLYMQGKRKEAFVVLLSGIGSLIAHYKGTQTFAKNWKEYWLALSLLGVAYTIAFGYGLWAIAACIASAVLAALVIRYGVEGVQQGLEKFLAWAIRKLAEGMVFALTELVNFLTKLLSGKWGWGKACLGGAVICFGIGLAGLMNPGLMEQSKAELLIVASVILFIASSWLGTDKLAKKYPVK